MHGFELVLGVLVCASATGGEPEREVRSALPKLPKGTTLAASLVREGNWYALGSNQIRSVRRVLAGAPFSAPPEMNVRLPPLEYKIILWTTGGRGLVPEDVVECDDRMNFLFSTKSGRFYALSGSAEQAEILKLIGAIRQGSDKGLETPTKTGAGTRDIESLSEP